MKEEGGGKGERKVREKEEGNREDDGRRRKAMEFIKVIFDIEQLLHPRGHSLACDYS